MYRRNHLAVGDAISAQAFGIQHDLVLAHHAANACCFRDARNGFYSAADVLSAVKWGVAGLALFQFTVVGKGFMGAHLEANRVLREVKRVELQLALLRAPG